MGFSNFICRSMFSTARIAMVSTLCCLPSKSAMAYTYIDPRAFAKEQSAQILRDLGASETLVKVNEVVSEKMAALIDSDMVQGMAKGTLSKEVWDEKYMQPDALYIYNLGKALAIRAKSENDSHKANVNEFADMFLGYGKHFERLKKYGLSTTDILVSPECDQHIDLLAKHTSIDKFYVAILTDMIPYVVFANYLLHSIGEADNNQWLEYAKKYGDLNNKYAKERLGKIIQVASRLLSDEKITFKEASNLFEEGFAFEEWFIRNAFTKGFTITASAEKNHDNKTISKL